MAKDIRPILYSVIVMIAVLGFAEPIYTFLHPYTIKAFSGFCTSPESDIVSIILAMTLLALVVTDGVASLARSRSHKINLVSLALAEFYLYIRIMHTGDIARFYVAENIAYSDVFMFVYTVWAVFPYIKTSLMCNEGIGNSDKDTNDFSDSLIGDDTRPEDVLGRKNEVDAVYKYLMNEENDNSHAIAIAITGTWGCGKTTFLNYFKDKLNIDGIAYFDYTPWNRSADNVTMDFLSHLESKLSDEGYESKSVRRYINSIKVSNATGWFPLILHIILQLISDTPRSTQGHIKAMEKDLALLKKPIVAIIDDADRVSGEDFKDVLGLIRSTVNSPNLIYIVAYDAERAKILLGDTGGKYLSKIFNVTHALVPIDEDLMQTLIGEALNHYVMHKSDYSENPFASVCITDYIQTMRDMYRFVNMMSKDYKVQNSMIEEVDFDFDFWAILELLKYHDPVTWDILQTQPTKYLKVDDADWTQPLRYALKDNVTIADEGTEKLLVDLFESRESIFQTPSCFKIAFLNQLTDNYLKKSDFHSYIAGDRLQDMLPELIATKDNLNQCLYEYDGFTIEQIIAIVTECLRYDNGIEITPDLGIIQSVGDTIMQSDFALIRKKANPYMRIEHQHELYLMFEKYAQFGDAVKMLDIESDFMEPETDIRMMLAVMYGWNMMEWQNGAFPDKRKYDVTLKLIARMTAETDMTDLKMQYYMLEALEYLNLYDTPGQFIMPLVEDNPEAWLRLSIRDAAQPFSDEIIADVDVLRTMFDTYETYKECMKRYEAELKQALANAGVGETDGIEYKIELIKEHQRLVKITELAGAYPDRAFSEKNYPLLSKIKCKDISSEIVAGRYMFELENRLKKKSVPFYFGGTRHVELF